MTILLQKNDDPTAIFNPLVREFHFTSIFEI